MKDIEGKVSVGAMKVSINCDVSQLDESIEKMGRLIELGTRAQELGALPAGSMVVPAILAAGLAKTGEARPRRRDLFRWMFGGAK